MGLRCRSGLGRLVDARGLRRITGATGKRRAVWSAIYDYLYSDKTGLPTDSYTADDVQLRADDVYQHVFQVYPTVPSPYYGAVGDAA